MEEAFPLIDETARKEKQKDITANDTIFAFTCAASSKNAEDQMNFFNFRSILHQHARDGNTDGLVTLLDQHPEFIDVVDEDYFTALHYACRYGHVDVAKELLKRGANPNAPDRENALPLHLTAKYCRGENTSSSNDHSVEGDFSEVTRHRTSTVKGNVVQEIISLLLEYKALIDAADNYGLTALHFAAMKANDAAATALVNHNANVNMPPLLTACVYGADSVVKILLEAGADLNISTSTSQNTVFHIAAQHGNKDTLQLLLNKSGKNGAEMLCKENSERKTPLCLSVEGNHPKTTKLILSFRNRHPFHGREEWMVHLAAEKGYLEVTKVLVENGGEVLGLDNDQRKPIHLAAKNNHKTTLEYLIEKAPQSVNDQDEFGMTPLLLAAGTNGARDAVKTLIDNRANIWAQDLDGRSFAFIAAKYGSNIILEYVLSLLKEAAKRSPKVVRTLRNVPVNHTVEELVNLQDHMQSSPMHMACTNGYLEICKILREYGASVEAIDEDEETPLHRAAARGNTICVRQLLEWEQRLVLGKEELGNTPLHLAAKGGHDASVRALLDAGAEKESKNALGQTPLEVGVVHRNVDAVRVLIERGALIQKRSNHKATTALHIAAANGDDDMIRMLIRYGADVLRLDIEGKTVFDISLEEGHRDVVKTLLEHDSWRELLEPKKERTPWSSTPRDTPMRRLLLNFPDLAPIAFDKCIIGHGDNEKDAGYRVQYDYTLIDDSYMILNDAANNMTAENPYDDFKLRTQAVEYTTDSGLLYKNHPLKIMAKSERLALLAHPLVLSLIKNKWNLMGRYVYYTAFLIYCVFIGLYTWFVAFTPPPFALIPNGEKNSSCPSIPPHRPTEWCRWAVIVLGSMQLVKEGFQMHQRRLSYFSVDNAIEVFIYSSAILTVWDFTCGVWMNWQWLLTAVTSFMCWMNLLLLVRKLPRFGIYVVMFFDILRTFSRFFIIFVLFVIGFSSAFFVIMQNKPEFSTLPSAILKTTVMMIGEFEYTAIFHGNPTEITENLFGYHVAYPLFILFCIIMTILLMNLLVGLAVDDIKTVQEKAELRRLSLQVDLVLQVEASLPPYYKKKMCNGYHLAFPNKPSIWKRLRSKVGFQAEEEVVVDVARTEEEEWKAEVKTSQRLQSSQMRNIQMNIDELHRKQLQIEAMLRALLRASNLDYNTQEIDD